MNHVKLVETNCHWLIAVSSENLRGDGFPKNKLITADQEGLHFVYGETDDSGYPIFINNTANLERFVASFVFTMRFGS
jgi:hypothetical protein